MAHPVAYLRKSKSDDPTREVSREVQEQSVRELAAKDGHNGDMVLYVDWDRSADESKTRRRTEFLRMLSAIERGEVSVVYAYAADRLYRSLLTYARLLAACQEHRVRIVTAREGEVGDDPDGEFRSGLGALLAARELNVAKARAKGAYEARLRRGDHIGTAPYGYRAVKVDGVLRLEPDPSRPVEPVLEAYRRSGRRPRAAVRILNDELHLPAPRGGTWDTQTLKRIVTREAPKLLPMRTASGRRDPVGKPAILAKLLRCPCGRLLTPLRHVERRWSRETSSMSYYCSRGQTERGTHPVLYVSERKLLEWVKAEAARFDPKADIGTRADSNARRDALLGQRERLGMALVDGLLSREAAKAKADAIDAELGALEATETAVELPQGIDWDRWDAGAINAVLRSLWQYVQLGPDLLPVEAEWRIPLEWIA